MAGSFVENINLLTSKLTIIEESNEIFDEGVIPVLEEIALLNLDEAILDLKKGNYLGNRKIDINLALNVQGITQELINKHPEQAEAIWVNSANTVLYNKATATFVDGTIIELPFLFDGQPVTISTHGDLLAQLTRLDYVHAQAQIDSLYQVTVGDYTNYTISIDSEPYTYTSGFNATRESIIAGIANMINAEAIPITARVTDFGAKLTLTADIEGNPFYAEVSPNMAIATIRPNRIEGPKETEFLAKLTGTLAANFASPVVGELVKLYDIIGQNSNLESLRLHAVSGSYIEEAPLYYWAKTTSAFQTLSMRANDIIKLGNEIDKIIKLASSIDEVIEIQKRVPQLVDTYDGNGNPNGDETIYNNLSELVEVHSKLTELITIYNDIKAGGTNYIQTIVENLEGSNTIGVVASDLELGIYSNIINTGSNIDKVTTVSENIHNVNAVAEATPNLELIVDTVIPNLPEILLADDKAIIATNKALEATNAAAIATAKNNEMKNVSVGSTITGASGTNASVVYNPATGKFTFVVPQGIKGEKGDAFQVNALGPIANRSLYDSMNGGFSFLAIDESSIYFKMSNTLGDWSIGSPFGKGDKGDKGDTGDAGNSIVNTVFTSTTDPSGLPGQSGATDTYTINYNNLETDTFTIKNGNDGLATVIDTLEFEVLADEVNYTVDIDTTNGVFEIYFNGMLLPTSEYSLTGSAVIVNKPVVIGDAVIVKKIASVDVLDTYSQVAIDTKIIEVGLQSKNYTDTSMATGNSATATKLHTPININGVSFDGSSDITVSDDTAVKLTGNQTIAGTKTFSSNIVGNVTGNLSGNATSATNASKLATPRQINGVNFDGSANITVVDSTKVALTGNETIAGIKTFSSTVVGDINGNAGTATKLQTARTINGVAFDGSAAITVSDATAVKLTGNQTIAGVKTFSSNIVGNITGNSGTATKLATARTINGVGFDGSANITVSDDTAVKLTGDQTIAGVKTFSSSPIVPTPTATTQAANKAYVDSKAETTWTTNDSRVKTALNASGSAPIYACRAWVNFNGTGTVAIRASGNVSSITDNGVGDYTVNFTTAMPDVNYSSSSMVSSDIVYSTTGTLTSMTTSSYRFSIVILQNGNAAVDRSIVHFNAFR